MDKRGRRLGILRDSNKVVSKRHVRKKNTKEGICLIAGTGLELGVDLNDKCGGNCREQASLDLIQYEWIKVLCRTHED